MKTLLWAFIWFTGMILICFIPELALQCGATRDYSQYLFGMGAGAWTMYITEVKPSMMTRLIDRLTRD